MITPHVENVLSLKDHNTMWTSLDPVIIERKIT